MKDKICECGRKLKVFFHNCPNDNNYNEIYGCPYCDDKCGYCIKRMDNLNDTFNY